MPYSIRKLPNQDLYRVYNKQTKVVHSYSTTLANAKKQVTLLNMVDAGVPLKKKKGKGARFSAQVQPEEEERTISISEDEARDAAARQQAAREAARVAREAARVAREAARVAEIEKQQLLNRLIKAKEALLVKPTNRNLTIYWRLREQYGITDEYDKEFPRRPIRSEEEEISTSSSGSSTSGTGTGASKVAPEPPPETNMTMNALNEETDQSTATRRVQRLIPKQYTTRKTPIQYKEVKRLQREALRTLNENNQREPIFNLIRQDEVSSSTSGAGTGASKVAPEPEKLGVEENSPAARRKELGRSIFYVKGRIKNLQGERTEILNRREVLNERALRMVRMSSPENLNDDKLKEDIEELQNIKQLLAEDNYRLKRYEKELASLSGKVGSGISNPKILELFKGTGSVGKQANKMGFKVTSLDLDPIYTPDIETDILEWDYKKWATENKYVPDMVWASPPCNTFSPLVYRLKERDVETAKPLSDRAKLGTKILYRTLEIIEYFLKKNPKLLFVIENPRGMMRKDAKMKKLERETTLYCLYGDFKKKPTDFWNNFPQGLNLDQETKQCPNKTIPVQSSKLTLDQRYSMPSKLIKHFLDEFKKQYSKSGGSIETDRFEEDGIVSLPKFRSVKINLPTYMYKKLPDINGKPPPYKYKLVVPITSSRNISSRKQETSLDISQKPVSKPNVVIAESEEQPNINDFSPADKAKIQAYYDKVAENEDENPDEIDKDEYVIKPRGKPLPCSKDKKVATKKPETQSVKAMVAAIDKPKSKSKPKSFTLTDEQSADLYLEDEAAFDLYNSNLEEFKKKYKGKYGKKFGFGVGKPVIQRSLRPTTPSNLGKVEQKNISTNSNMANSWITYVKSYAAKNGMSYRDALRDPKCKAGYRKEGSGASMGMKAKVQPDTTPSTDIPVSNIKNPLTKQQRTRTKVMDLRQASQTMAAKIGRGIVNEMAGQALVAMAYNDSELGANAGRKFISL